MMNTKMKMVTSLILTDGNGVVAYLKKVTVPICASGISSFQVTVIYV